jgi:hypothetical protein
MYFRRVNHYYSGDIFVRDDTELTMPSVNGVASSGIDNRDQRSVSNIYEYRDTPPIGSQKKSEVIMFIVFYKIISQVIILSLFEYN